MKRSWPCLLLLLLISACSRPNDEPEQAPPLATDDFPANQFLVFPNPLPVDSDAYATAYYKAIDPTNAKDSFTKWRDANGFTSLDPGSNVVFLDTHDLGYGRNMTMRRTAAGTPLAGVAVYVENYRVPVFAGQNYTQINLDAAVARSRRYLAGYNAIEWGPQDADGNGAPDDLNGDGAINAADYLTRFYSFAPDGARVLSVDMDGKGRKGMPTTCISCHGGRQYPLLPDGSFAAPDGGFVPAGGRLPVIAGDTRARLQPLNLDTLTYATDAGYTRADQEANFKLLNLAVYDSYERNATPPPGHWNSTIARSMLESWYGGAALPAVGFTGGFVPPGWRMDATPTPAAGADNLYREVIGPSCMTCHMLRGNSHMSDMDFATYAKFSPYARAVQALVFDRGNMPLSRVGYERLHADTAKLELLASFIPGFNRRDSSNRLLEPGRPIANAGVDRSSPSPAALNGAASLFADTYAWAITTVPAGASASLDDANAVRPLLSANMDGVYTLSLIVSRDGILSAADTVNVTVNSAMPLSPKNLTFNANIRPVLQTAAVCQGCHRSGSPVFNTGLSYDTPLAGENRDLYQAVRARIDFTRPELSLLLTKPTGSHHFGGVRPGFDMAAGGDRSNYDLFLNWILEGAKEN